ncbi:MAG: hypothetical protein KAI47_12600 [Deltaproteobacteria bacterium]|nr:hypothetical protein [Deltaproteobacteria bacterium]
MPRRQPIFRTADSSHHEVTLIGLGDGVPSTDPTCSPNRDVAASLPHIEADVLIVPLGDHRPSWRQTPTDLTLEKVKRTASSSRGTANATSAAEPPRSHQPLRPFWVTADTITPRGMHLFASTPVAENQWVVVEIHLAGTPRRQPPMRIKALVNFTMEGIGFGVRFIAMTDRTRRQLDTLTQATRQRAA